jgi:serine/threonine protein kinase
LALDAAHARGLIHRDVKPANLLLEGDHLFLTDFGVAKAPGGPTRLTRVGFFVGTIDYASPEQIRQEPLDGRSDLYSLACVLYQCLTGSLPFDRPTEHAIVQAHLTEMPAPVRSYRSDLPASLDALFATAMAKDRETRYRSGRFLADAARWALQGASQGTRARATVVDVPILTAPPSNTPSPATRAPSPLPGGTIRRRRLLVLSPVALIVAGVALYLGYPRFASMQTPAAVAPDSQPTANPTATATVRPTISP